MRVAKFLIPCLGLTLFLSSCSHSASNSGTATYALSFKNSDGSTANTSGATQALQASANATDTETFTITNGSSVAVTPVVGTISNSTVSVSLASGCTDLAANASCTGTITFAPTTSIQSTALSIPFTYGASKSATFYTTLSNGTDAVQGFMFGETGSSLANRLQATTKVNEKVFSLDPDSGVSASTLPLSDSSGQMSTISKIAGVASGGNASYWAYGALSTTQYDVDYSSDGTTWTDSWALPDGFTPLGIKATATGSTRIAYIYGINASNELLIYKFTNSSGATGTSLGSTGITLGDGQAVINMALSDGAAIISYSLNQEGGATSRLLFYPAAGNPSTTTVNAMVSNLQISPSNTSGQSHIMAVTQSGDNGGTLALYSSLSNLSSFNRVENLGESYAPVCNNTAGSCSHQDLAGVSSASGTDGLFELITNGSNYKLARLAKTGTSWETANLTGLSTVTKVYASGGNAIVTGADGQGAFASELCMTNEDALSCEEIGSPAGLTLNAVDNIVPVNTGSQGMFVMEGMATATGGSTQEAVLGYINPGADLDDFVQWIAISANSKSLGTVDGLFSDPASTDAYVLGFNTSGAQAYSMFDAADSNWSTAATLGSTFMVKNMDTGDFSLMSSVAGKLIGIEQSQLSIGVSFYKGQDWTESTSLESLLSSGTVDNFAWSPSHGFASSTEACTTGVCNEQGWLLVASGNAHRTLHFKNDTPTDSSPAAVTGMSDVGKLFASAGQAIAVGSDSKGQLAFSYYNTSTNAWPSEPTAVNSQFYSGYDAVRQVKVTASNGAFWALYRSGPNAYKVTYHANGASNSWTTADNPLGSSFTPTLIASTNGEAWVAGTNGTASGIAWFHDGSWGEAATLPSAFSQVVALAASKNLTTGVVTTFVLGRQDSESGSTYHVAQLTGDTVGAVDDLASTIEVTEGANSLLSSNGTALLVGYSNTSSGSVFTYFNGSTWSTPSTFVDSNGTAIFANVIAEGSYTVAGKYWIRGYTGDESTGTWSIGYFNGSQWSKQTITGMNEIFQFMPFGGNIMAVGINADNAAQVDMSVYNSASESWGTPQAMANFGLQNSREHTYSGNHE